MAKPKRVRCEAFVNYDQSIRCRKQAVATLPVPTDWLMFNFGDGKKVPVKRTDFGQKELCPKHIPRIASELVRIFSRPNE